MTGKSGPRKKTIFLLAKFFTTAASMAEATESTGLLEIMGFKPKASSYGSKSSSSSKVPFVKATIKKMVKIPGVGLVTYDQIYVCGAVGMLVIGTALERITFKIMVDRMLPYKFVLMQIIFLLSSIVFGCLSRLQGYMSKEMRGDLHDFPHANIFKMAAVDTIPFMFMVFSATGVPPTMTVILMHASTIFVVLGSKYVFPHRSYTSNNYWGIGLIGISILVCLLKTLVIHLRMVSASSGVIAWDSLAFVGATSVLGITTLYKEKNIIDWSKPIDNFYLSSTLFLYQFVVILCLAVTVNLFRAIVGWDDFENLFQNVYNGWKCFFGIEPAEYQGSYVYCSDSIWVVLGYVVSNAMVVVSMNYVLQASNLIIGRATEAAIIAAFLVLWLYDTSINTKRFFGGNEGLIDILAIGVLVWGMETYEKDPEPDVEIITNSLSNHKLQQQTSGISNASSNDESGI